MALWCFFFATAGASAQEGRTAPAPAQGSPASSEAATAAAAGEQVKAGPSAEAEGSPAAPTSAPSAAPAAAAPAATPAPGIAAPTRAIPPAADDEESLRPFADEDAAPRSRLAAAAWIGTGVTVALLGVAAFYAAKAGEKASDVNRLTSNFDPTTDLPVEYSTVAGQYTAAMRDGKHDDRMAKGFAIAAGATALTSAALFIIDAVRKPELDSTGKPRASLTPLVTAQGAGLGLGGTF